jgi:hypothetical protein
MSAGIKEICDRAEVLILAATPDVEAYITYRRAPNRVPLEELAPVTPSESTRLFQVRPGPLLDPGTLMGAYTEIVQTVEVAIGYCVQGNEDEADRRLARLAYSDVARIYRTLHLSPQSGWSTATVESGLNLLSTGAPTPTDHAHWYVARHLFAVSYTLE